MRSDAFILRQFFKAELPTVNQWFQARGWPAMPQEALPPYGLVVVQRETGSGVCAGWLYSTDSCLRWMEWVIANPECGAREVHRGIDLLLGGLKAESTRRGPGSIFTICKSKGLMRLYERHGFKCSDIAMTTMVAPC